jgi:TRAP-type C4-dicarboxylate transport system permease small subunit
MQRERSIIEILPVVLSVCCISFAFWLVPKTCTLFSSNVPGSQMCHTIPMPEGCFDSYCQNIHIEYIASIIAGFGICLLIVPFIVDAIREKRNQPIERTKLFD